MAILAAVSSRDQPIARLRRLGPSAAPFERVDRCNTYRPWRHFGDYVDKVFAGPKRLFLGPGGNAHESWRVGDVLCHHATDGKCLLFQVIEPVDLKPFLRSAPTVMLLDWNDRTPPTEAEIATLRPALDHINLLSISRLCTTRVMPRRGKPWSVSATRRSSAQKAFARPRRWIWQYHGRNDRCDLGSGQRKGRRGEFGRPPGGDYRRPHLFAQQRLPVRAGRQG
jgi:hypothetical protein